MKEQQAAKILQALIEGSDPETGEELAEGSVMQRADVMRAMLAGLAALTAQMQRASRRSALPPNIGKTWSEKESARLLAAFKKGETVEALAESHGRSVRAIEARLEKQGLLSPADRKTADRFTPNKSES